MMATRILIVDDSASMRMMLNYALSNRGFGVIEAPDGEAALERLETVPVNMIITDVNMPGLDGIELIRKVRASKRHNFLPIILLTTESAEEKKRAGRDAGATGWVVKPFRPDQLVWAVKKCLGEPLAPFKAIGALDGV